METETENYEDIASRNDQTKAENSGNKFQKDKHDDEDSDFTNLDSVKETDT